MPGVRIEQGRHRLFVSHASPRSCKCGCWRVEPVVFVDQLGGDARQQDRTDSVGAAHWNK